MAATLSSSRHSNRTQQNQLGRAANSFVFGSSTPRELSHISTVSRRERLIDTKLKPKPHPADGEKRDIIYYMRQARSIECKASTRKGLPQNYAFGSSTPRSLSHLNKLAKEQRVYDAKMEKRKSDAAQRSETNPQLFRLTYGQRQSLSKVDDEEASSEPDIIQHRQKEFGLLGSRAANRKEKAESPVESRKPSKSKQAGDIERKSVKSKMTEAGEDSDGEEKVNELPLDLMQNHHRAVSKEVIVAEDDKSQPRMRELLEPLAAEVQKAVPVQQQIVRERDESSE